MILLAKIVGFGLILFGIVLTISIIPYYRAYKSEETKFFQAPKDSNRASEVDDTNLPEGSIPFDYLMFIKTFVIPPVLMLVLGITIFTIAFKFGASGAAAASGKG